MVLLYSSTSFIYILLTNFEKYFGKSCTNPKKCGCQIQPQVPSIASLLLIHHVGKSWTKRNQSYLSLLLIHHIWTKKLSHISAQSRLLSSPFHSGCLCIREWVMISLKARFLQQNCISLGKTLGKLEEKKLELNSRGGGEVCAVCGRILQTVSV